MTSSSLTTRCAHCQTVFRATTAQLQAHAGQVRCGRCMQIFDALAALAPEPAPAPLEAATAVLHEQPAVMEPASAPEPEIKPDPGPAAPEPAAELPSASPEALPANDPGFETFAEQRSEQAASVEQPAADLEISPPVQVAPELAESAVVPDADNPFTHAPAASTVLPQRRLRLAAVLLGLLLAAQATFFYRSEVAARFPLAKQGLGWLCEKAGCAVTLPQRPQSILIEASDLQVIDPANPNRIQLTATLRNHAGHDVAYPALDLVLTNVNDHTLARRIFLPAEYLGAGRDIGTGIAANAEMTVRLALETGNLGAAGFRLAVLAAPLR